MVKSIHKQFTGTALASKDNWLVVPCGTLFEKEAKVNWQIWDKGNSVEWLMVDMTGRWWDIYNQLMGMIL